MGQKVESGETFGRWLVVSETCKRRYYRCRCSCGNEKDIRVDSLLNGDSTSCGCFAAEKASERSSTHGLSRHKLYQTWYDMMRRCTRKSRKDYKYYGGRGIKLCERWSGDAAKGFKNFLEDMENSYKEGLELDRVDVNGDYCKDNCRWVDRRIQVINRRPTGSNFDTRFITYKGKTLCLSQWSEEVGISYRVLIDRLGKLGWSVEKAFNTELRSKRLLFEIQCNQNMVTLDYITIKTGKSKSKFSNLWKSDKSRAVEYATAGLVTCTKVYGEYSGKLKLLWRC